MIILLLKELRVVRVMPVFDLLIAQQSADMDGVGSGGFSDIFSTIVASVGASVRSNEQALDGAEATKEAAIESEAEFSGDSDSEAAALIEFQQPIRHQPGSHLQQESCFRP